MNVRKMTYKELETRLAENHYILRSITEERKRILITLQKLSRKQLKKYRHKDFALKDKNKTALFHQPKQSQALHKILCKSKSNQSRAGLAKQARFGISS